VAVPEIGSMPKLGRNVLTLAVTALLLNVAMNMYDPFLSLFFIQLGISTVLLGLVFSIYRIGFSILMLPGGYLADKFGRKRLIVLGCLVYATFLLPIYWSNSWILALAFLVCAQLGISIYQPGTQAMLTESLTDETRAAGFGAFWSITMIGGLIGPVIAGYMSADGNYKPLFLAASAIMFGVTLLRYRFLQETKKERRLGYVSREAGFIEKLNDTWNTSSSVKSYIIWSSLYEFGFQLMLPYTAVLWSLMIHMDAFLIGIASSVFMLLMIVAEIPGGRLSDRIGRKPCIILSILGLMASTLIMIFSTFSLEVILSQAVGGVFAGLGHGASEALPGELVNEEIRGTAIGVFRTTSGLVGGFGPLTASLVCSIYPFETFPRTVFYAYLLIDLVCAIVLALFVKETLMSRETKK